MIQNQFNYLLIILYHFEFEFLFSGDFSRQPVRIVHQIHSFFFFFFFFNNIYLVTTLLMTILTFTWRKNKNKVQEIKEKYDVTAFATN